MLSNLNKSASPHIELTLLTALLRVQHTYVLLAIPYPSSQPPLPYRRAGTGQNVLGARNGQLAVGRTVSMDQELFLAALGQSHTEEP